MGFSEGRDLVQRADEFIQVGGVPDDARKAAHELLHVLSTDVDLVSVETRRLICTAKDAIDEFGWAAGRATYSAYLMVRSSIHAIMKHTVGAEGWLGNGAGLAVAASAFSGDPEMQFLRAAIPVLRDHGVQMLAFTNHSPEMRAYVEWVLHTLKLNHSMRD